MNERPADSRQNDAAGNALAMTQAASFELGGLVVFVLPILVVVLLAVLVIGPIRGAPI